MRPLELRMRNFLVWTDTTVDLSNLSCAVISGPNGSGKSGIFDGILVALFGRATKAGAKGMDEYITTGKSEYQVELIFEVEGRVYRVVRSRGRSKNVLDLFVQKGVEGMFRQWESLSDNATATATQAKIEALVRMDYKTFTASSIVLQGQADAFTKGMEDGDRRQVLSKILGLDLYEDLLKSAKDEAKGRSPVVQQLQSRIREMSAADTAETLSPLLEDAKARLKEASESLNQAEREYNQAQARAAQEPLVRSQLEEAQRRAGDQDSQIRAIDKEIEAAEASIKRLNGMLDRKDKVTAAEEEAGLLRPMLSEMEDAAQKQAALNKKIAEATAKASAWQANHKAAVARAEMALSNAEKIAADIDTVPCAGCGLRDEGPCQENCKYLIDAIAARDKIPELQKALQDLQAETCPQADELTTLQDSLAGIDYDAEAHRQFRKDLAALEPLLELRTKIAGAEAEINAAKDKIESALERRTKIAEEVGSGRRKLQELRDRLKELSPLTTEVSVKRRALDEKKASEAACRTEVGRLEQRLSDAARNAEALAKTEARLAEERQELQALELLVQSFGPKGIPAVIQKNVVPEIEVLANKMLDRLARGRFQIELKTEREGKTTGTEQEILKVVVYDRGVERGYLTYSGAERFMIDIAIRCAISHFLANRAGAEIRLFVLDEGLGCCDASNRDAVVATLLEIAKDFGLVLIITHLDELKDAFPQQIKVTPGPEGSSLEVVA